MNPFFEVYTQSLDATRFSIYWGLTREFSAPGPLVFTVYTAEDGKSESWDQIAEVTDSYFVDNIKVSKSGKELALWFKIVLTDGTTKRYSSDPFQAAGLWSKRDWLLARKICWLEMRNIIKAGGGSTIRGKMKFMKERGVGDNCPHCYDPAATTGGDSNCRICFGTGVVGGYYPAIDVYVADVKPYSQQDVFAINQLGPQGTEGNRSVRMIAYPRPSSSDLFIDPSSGYRYSVDKVNPVASVAGHLLVCVIDLLRIPANDAKYALPLDGTPVSNVVPTYTPDAPATATQPVISWSGRRWVLSLNGTPVYTASTGVPVVEGITRTLWNITESGAPADFTASMVGDTIKITGGSLPGDYIRANGYDTNGLPEFVRRQV